MLAVISTPTPEYLCILLRGHADSGTAAQLQEALEQALAEHAAQRCVLDLSELVFISSAGLRVMLAIARRIRNTGGQIVLCRTQPPVLAVLELAGFTRILGVVPDLAAARERLMSG
jgi:stage II sporulation protein AA (anti-sigma F factor antagonist)